MRVCDKDPKDLEAAMQAALLVEAYSTNRHKTRTEPEGNPLSVLTESIDRMPVSKYTGRSRNVRVETQNEPETKKSEAFIRQVYESLREKLKTSTNLKSENHKNGYGNGGPSPQIMSYPMNL